MYYRDDPRFKNDQSAQKEYQNILLREEDKQRSPLLTVVESVTRDIDIETRVFGDGTHKHSVY